MSSEEEQANENIDGMRNSLNRLEQRFSTFTQQQFSFIAALDRCRQIAFEPSREIATISQVAHYADHVSDNATDKRIMRMFLNIVKDLNEFRRKLVKLTNQPDEKLNQSFAKWKKTLEPTQNITQLRVRFPNSHLNHLSVTESRYHFGGIISVLPTAMDCAREALNRIESTRAYRLRKSVSRGSYRSVSASLFRNISSARGFNMPVPGKKVSPMISSPVPSNTISLSASSRFSKANGTNQNYRQGRSMSANPAYKRQVYMSQHPAVATQTPKFLGSTVKPTLNWNHQTLTEEEIKKTLKERKSTALARPQWKP